MIKPSENTDRLDEALANCEAEPVRTPDRVQAHGGLIVVDKALSQITHVSANITEYLSFSASELLGASAHDVLGSKAEHALRNALSVSTIGQQREFLGNLSLNGKNVQACAHLRGDRLLLELSKGEATVESQSFGMQRLRWLMTRQIEGLPLNEALDGMVRNLRAISGFDRVMAYRFRPDGSGEVVAEAKSRAAESYLNLRFPASDIPKNARDICLEQPVRCIADTEAADIALLANDRSEPPLDMTLCELRGTSPVHLQYLRNMGVGATLTLPIVVENVLWGLFACHHGSSKRLRFEETLTYDLVGQIMNAGINGILRRRLEDRKVACLSLMQRLGVETKAAPNNFFSDTSWKDLAAATLRLFSADGLLLQVGDRWNSAGLQPPVDRLADLHERLVPQGVKEIACASDLGAGKAAFHPVAGALCMQINADPGARLWVFRDEENSSVTWAGAPEKDLEAIGGTVRLHPRSSFESYRQEMIGCSRAWEPDDLALAEAYRATITLAIGEQLKRAADHHMLGLKVQELNHRVRNTISLVRAIGQQGAIGKTDLAAFMADFDARLRALARVHGVNAEAKADKLPTGWDFSQIIAQEMAPYDQNRVLLDGPSVYLSESAATILTLLVHELATNAVKHGALCSETGQVKVSWRIDNGALRFEWAEQTGRPVNAPESKGFGSFLLKDGVEYQLSGQGEITYGETGVRVHLFVPKDHLLVETSVEAVSSLQIEEPLPRDRPQIDGEFGRVLLVEDDFMVAISHRNQLLSAGASRVTLAGSNARALEAIEAERPDCAVLDISLGAEDSGDTARQLVALGIPFVFLSGNSTGSSLTESLPQVPLVAKPASAEALAAALESQLLRKTD